MRVLLDTCTFLWLVEGSDELSSRSREIIVDVSNELYLSSASAWEIALKFKSGRLLPRRDPQELIPEQRDLHKIASLPVSEDAALQTARLPDLHRDPFDRMLVAQAIVEGLTMLTPDQAIRQYAVRSIW